MCTRMIESPIRTPVFTVPRCTRHSLKLIATVYGDEWSVKYRRHYRHYTYALTRQEKVVTELRNPRVSIVLRSTRYAETCNTERQKELLVQPPTAFR